MKPTTTFQLDDAQARAARVAAGQGCQFLEEAGFSLGVATIDHAWNGGSGEAVVEQLGAFQNEDGGFGRGLEVDIESPASNPFAARLAMSILLGLDTRRPASLESNLQRWLVANQDDDGDWHFSSETKASGLAPWFAGWTFPSLNPACCLAGLANQLGIATPDMLDRVARLFGGKATLDEARTGDFYTLLPYAEYAGGVTWTDRDSYVDAIAGNIVEGAKAGTYADAGHFWEHALGGGSDVAARIPQEVLAQNANRLMTEQTPDGGWPTPYNDAWRPFFTAQACVTLARLRDGI
ncbi:MAG: hypothetical protein M3457_04990 [Chloroflexota bacterium]|nr:hypothetical protein [Chloroflexota bacterium]